MLSVEAISAALGCIDPRPVAFAPEARHASVAMILSPGETELEACFIRRAERPGDPWSGQVAFPGGRASPGDPDAAAVAERETLEEIGLEISSEHRLGALPTHAIRANRTLSPFIYYVPPHRDVPPPQHVAHVREPHEVAAVFWVPLSHLFDESTCTTLDYPSGGVSTSWPGIAYDDHVIWGLTLRVLGTFADMMKLRLPALP